MCRSEYVYHRLRRFRAGIVAGISWLKRSMGLARCMWKGWHGFIKGQFDNVRVSDPIYTNLSGTWTLTKSNSQASGGGYIQALMF